VTPNYRHHVPARRLLRLPYKRRVVVSTGLPASRSRSTALATPLQKTRGRTCWFTGTSRNLPLHSAGIMLAQTTPHSGRPLESAQRFVNFRVQLLARTKQLMHSCPICLVCRNGNGRLLCAIAELSSPDAIAPRRSPGRGTARRRSAASSRVQVRAPACSGLTGVCPAWVGVGRNRTVVGTGTPRDHVGL
jgi:hypothetical protein